MLESGASRWLEPELSAAVRMAAASAALRAGPGPAGRRPPGRAPVRGATRAVRRDIFSSWRGVGDVELCARPVPAAHACAPKSRRSESFSGGSGRKCEPAGLALDRDGVVEALQGCLAVVADDVGAQRDHRPALEVPVP